MSSTDTMIDDEAAQALFIDRMPWYLNGTLDATDKAWVENRLNDSPWARGMVELETMLVGASLQPAPEPTGDLGLARLMAQVQLEARQAAAKDRRAATNAASSPWWQRWQSWRESLTTPRFALAAWAVVLVQTAWLGSLTLGAADTDELTRAGHVQVQRRLRVNFVPGTTEEQMRLGLIAAGARIVAGPSQFGEYWLASDMNSLDEVRARLAEKGLLESSAVDETTR
jgi:hypothetical protein